MKHTRVRTFLKDWFSDSRTKTISVIAKTRRWTKDNTVKKNILTFNDPNEKSSMYLTVLIALYKMTHSDTLNPKIQRKITFG